MADGCHFYPDPRSDKVGKIKYTSNSKSLTLISMKFCILNNITSQITKYSIGHCLGRHFESAHRVELYNFTLLKLTSNSNLLGLNAIKTYFEYHRKSINHQKHVYSTGYFESGHRVKCMPNHKNYNYEFHELNNSPNDVLLILRNPKAT